MIETIISEQAKIVVEKRGNKEPIILLHAGIANRNMWRNEMDFLKKDYCVINIDLPGFGESKILKDKIDYTAVIKTILDFYELSAVNILAASFGAKIAIDFCLLYPEKVKKMILISPAVSGWSDSSELLKYERNEEAAEGIEEVIKLNYDFWIRRNRPEKEINNKVKELIFKMLHENDTLEESEYEEIEQIKNSLKLLQEIENEILIINGALDVSDFLLIGSRIHKKVLHSSLALIPATAHLPNLENGELVKKHISNYLAIARSD